MWIKTTDGDLLKIGFERIYIDKTYSGFAVGLGNDGVSIFISESRAEAQEVLDYIWHRLEMNKNTCDLTRFKNREAERSAEWPGCGYDDKPKVHRNFEYEGIPEADK